MQLIRCRDRAELSSEAARYIVEAARLETHRKGWWTLVLSGGTTPGLLYECLASPAYRQGIDWNRTHVFWGDERCVEPNHLHSNYRLARDSLLSKVNIPAQNIHRIRGESSDPRQEALRYEQEVREFFLERGSGGAGEIPAFDLVLLGIGADGHVASLFPGSSALEERKRWVVEVYAPQGYVPEQRITLTLPVINNAREVLFLVAGEGKAGVLQDIMKDHEAARKRYPAARVTARERVVWLVDTATVRI